MLTLPRGSAHEIVCISVFILCFSILQADKGLYAGLYDFTQRHLGHGGRGQIFLTACRLDQVFDQAVHADNLLV